MKLFTKEIDQKLFDQYMMGNDLENQMVVAKIFNPYGNGVWYLLNSDPSDPDYLWAIVDLFEVEVGSVSREELETLKVPPFRLGLERDLYFTPMNAKKLYEALLSGEKFEDGGTIDIIKDKSGESWVFPNNPQGETYGIKLAAGGMTAGRWYKDNSGQELRYIGESQGKLLFKDGEKVVYKQESDFQDAPAEKRRFGFFEDGGKTQSKRYKVNVYYGGEMEDEEFYTDSLDEAESASQGGEHSEIYDNHKKEFVELEYAKGGKLPETIGGYKIDFSKWREDVIATIEVEPNSAPYEPFYLKGVGKTEKQAFQNLEKEYNSMKKSSYVVTFSIDDSGWIKSKPISAYTEEQASNILYESASMDGDVSILKIDKISMADGGMMAKGGNTEKAFEVILQLPNGKMNKRAVLLAKTEDDASKKALNLKEFKQYGYIVISANEIKYAKGGGVGFEPYGETKGIYKVYYKADGKPQTEIWETKEMAVNTAKRYSSPQMQGEFTNVKVFDEDGAEVDYMSEAKYEDGGDTDEGVDLFEDYDDIPENVQKVLDKHSDAFENEDYKGLEKAKKDLEKIGYTFEYGLDGTAYDLRKIGQKGKSGEEYAKGGMTKFKEKVQSIKASLLKRKKVSPKVQKDYGKTYSPKEAEESAKRIAGSMVKKEKRQSRVSKMLEKMKKGTQLNKKKSTFKDRMKDLSIKIKERKSKSTK
jgi:uncharacterized protein (UPF0254 family)